nr:hypothetical protein [Candidatus Sigynarchaeota archaeon]
MAVEWYVLVSCAIVPFLVTFLILPKQIKIMHKIDWIGHDIHKLAKPAVAESGGISVLVGLVVGLVLLMILAPADAFIALAVLLSILCAAGIGFLDDKYRFSAFKKIAFSIFAAIPMAAFYWFTTIIPGDPAVPFLGFLRVPILFLPFIPGFLVVLMNATNMYEGYNGQGSSTSIIAALCLIVGALINGSAIALVLSLVLLASLLAFFSFNKFPAKVFPGDIGTLMTGMMLGCIAIMGKLEFALIIALIPHIFNAFHVIRSVRGFKESNTIKVKDIDVVEGDLIKASTQKGAPLTIPRILTAGKPLSEPDLVANIIALNVMPAVLSILSSVLIRVETTAVPVEFMAITLLLWIAIAVVLFILLFKAFPAIRGLNVIFCLIYLFVLGLLVIIDQFVVYLGFYNWLVAGAIALAGLGAWYILSMKYFARILTRKGA